MDPSGVPACDQTPKEGLRRAPPEMELEVQWQEHELGEDPMIVLRWDDAMRGKPGGARLSPERIRCAELWWRN